MVFFLPVDSRLGDQTQIYFMACPKECALEMVSLFVRSGVYTGGGIWPELKQIFRDLGLRKVCLLLV